MKTEREATAVAPATEETAAPAAKVVRMSSIMTDVEAQDGGGWVAIPNMEPARLRVRSLDFPRYKAALARHQTVHQRKHKGVPSEKALREDYEARGLLLAEHILLGWEGFDEAYTPELAAERLPDRAWRQLRDFVLYAASEVGEQAAEFIKATEKN